MTEPIRTDYNERMAHSIMMAAAIMPDMAWQHRLRWWAWKRYGRAWMFWDWPPRPSRPLKRLALFLSYVRLA